jgi:hypothetical protein
MTLKMYGCSTTFLRPLDAPLDALVMWSAAGCSPKRPKGNQLDTTELPYCSPSRDKTAGVEERTQRSMGCMRAMQRQQSIAYRLNARDAQGCLGLAVFVFYDVE